MCSVNMRHPLPRNRIHKPHAGRRAGTSSFTFPETRPCGAKAVCLSRQSWRSSRLCREVQASCQDPSPGQTRSRRRSTSSSLTAHRQHLSRCTCQTLFFRGKTELPETQFSRIVCELFELRMDPVPQRNVPFLDRNGARTRWRRKT
jgi:hypothetical protein